jgi:hypothetical protein
MGKAIFKIFFLTNFVDLIDLFILAKRDQPQLTSCRLLSFRLKELPENKSFPVECPLGNKKCLSGCGVSSFIAWRHLLRLVA